MAVLPPADAVPIVSWAREHIRPEQLAPDGFDAAPHVTVLYGFQPQIGEDRGQAALLEWGWPQLRFTLGPVSRFNTSPEHDVLKVDVKWAEDLKSLNRFLVERFAGELTQTYPDYCPHMTLAYVRKGEAPELDGHAEFDGNTYVLRDLIYSLPESKRKFPLRLE